MPDKAELTPGLQGMLKEPVFGQLATLMPDGSPQVTLVWLDTDGDHVLVNTGTDHRKAKNAQRDPRVALNVHDARAIRIAHIRGRVVESTEAGADEHIDQLAKKYLGAEKYPWRRPGEQRVILKIKPEHVYSVGVDGNAWVQPDAEAKA